MKKVIVELVVPAGISTAAALDSAAQQLPALVIDKTYEPVPMSAPSQSGVEIAQSQQVIIIRGEINDGAEDQLKTAPGVIGVWSDAHVEPFGMT